MARRFRHVTGVMVLAASMLFAVHHGMVSAVAAGDPVPDSCDFNGDGYGDLVVGAPGEDHRTRIDTGAVAVWFGSPTGITVEGNRLFPRVSEFRSSGDRFGQLLACGDGSAIDVVSPFGPRKERYGDRSIISLGVRYLSTANAMALVDFDGDGHVDMAVGDASTSQVTITPVPGTEGYRHDFKLSQDSPGMVGAVEFEDRFGAALAAGDIDGDGFGDVVVGVPGENGAGAIHVVFGAADDGPFRNALIHQDTPGVPGISQSGDEFGATLAVGDVTGDGYDDVVVGAPGQDGAGGAADVGAVWLFPGGPDGLVVDESIVFQQDSAGVRGVSEPGDRFGAVLAVGDIHGDGFDDLIVGVPDEDVGPRIDAGAVWIFSGTPTGVSFDDEVILNQGFPGAPGALEAGDRFGAAVTTVRFDGVHEHVVVGVPGENDSAGVFMVFGTSAAGIDPANITMWSQAGADARGLFEPGDETGASLAG